MKRKFLSVILAMSLVFSMASAVGITAHANEKQAVKLDSNLISYSSISDECRIIPCEALNGVYFLNNSGLMFYSLNTHESEFLLDLSEKYDGHTLRYCSSFAAGNNLYLLRDYPIRGTSSYTTGFVITVYNLAMQEISKTIEFPYDFTYIWGGESSIGADEFGNIYITGENVGSSEYSILKISLQGEIENSYLIGKKVYDFCGFDSTNGNIYLDLLTNWVYWGYDHYMSSVYRARLNDGEFELDSTYFALVSQRGYNNRKYQVEFLNGKYLCMDRTFTGNLEIYNSSALVDELENVQPILSIGRNGNSGEDSRTSAVGTRTVFNEKYNSVFTYVDDSTIGEYDLKSGSKIAQMKTQYPLFSLTEYGDSLFAVEKSGNDYFYEILPEKNTEKIFITADSSTMQVGTEMQLNITNDSQMADQYTFVSSAPTVVSVNDNGKLFAWKKGTAQITVSNANGISAAYTVNVTQGANVVSPTKNSVVLNGASSYNISQNGYSRYSDTIKSYLYENSDKTLTRVESIDNSVIIETYSADGDKLINKQTLKNELDIFGGFYSGKDNNYLVFGQYNESESDSTEVMRVVKYSKDWKRISSASVKGENTYIPFDAGCLRMTEASGKLYVYTCHEMYQSDDGYHHQANMTFVFDESNLSVVDSFSDVMNLGYGYVSHSFNQFIQTDGEYIYRADHGDAYPRGISITKCDVNGDITDVAAIIPVEFSGECGDNYTNATVGGFELSSENCIIAGSMGDHTKDNWNKTKQNIFLSISKKDFSSTQDIIWFTHYTSSDENVVGTPQLVKIGNDQYLLMWEEMNTSTMQTRTKMVTVDSNGNKTSDTVSTNLHLSDCQPIKCSDGLVRWYYTDNSKPTMCVVNPLDLESMKKLVYGDANDDGKVTASDVLLIRKSIAGQIVDLDNVASDVNCDGKLTASDVLMIRKHIAGQNIVLGK